MYIPTMSMNKARKVTLLAAASTALAAAAGAAASSQGTNLSLVAYSTPKPVLAKIIAAFQKTPDGSGVLAVLRPLDEPGEGGRRRAARRPRLPLDGRRRQPARRRRPRLVEVGQTVLRRDRRGYSRRLR